MTFFSQFLFVQSYRLFDHISVIMILLVGCMAAGSLMHMQRNRKYHWMRSLGWGMMVGSICTLLAIFLYLLWLPAK